ncbi:MAG: choice-of-anchor B family protein [Flavobacteriales bacterium]
MKKNLILLFTIISLTGFTQDSLNIEMLFNWKDPSITGSSLYNNAYNEIWGYELNGREYAIIGSSRGTHFFDVTNPSSAVMVDFIQGRDTGSQIVHRDYHDYRGYLYMVTDEGDGSMQIVDMSYLPDSVKLVYDQDTAIKLSHNIFIDTSVGKLYSCGGGNSKKFNVFSLSNPLDPQLILSCENDITWWPSTVGTGGYVHDAFARNDTVYCNAGNGLYVVDFISTPTLLGNLSSYPDKGYNHSGWLSEDGKTYVMADETWGKKLKMVDVSDLTNIQFLDTVGINGDNNAIVHNPIIKGDYVYVAYYYDGVYIYDIKNPSNPLLVGYYDCSSELNFRSYKGAWGVYPFLSSGNLLVSDMQEGLFVFDVSTAVSGVAELKTKERFKLFPNPGRNEINLIGISNFDETYSLKIFDASGKQVHSQELKNNFLGTAKIELSNEIPKGIYVVTIFNGTFVQNIKYIKQ